MKTIILKGCMTLLAFSFVLFACKEDEQVRGLNRLEKVDEIAKTYGGQVATAEAKVSQLSNGDLVVNFSTEKELKTLRLQVNRNVQQVPVSGTYTILYLQHIAVLSNVESGKKYLLTVSKAESLYLTNKLPKSYLEGIQVLDGYGLVMSTSSKSARVVPDCATAGGPGASSCTNACCSTSCKSGLDAYCGATCECKIATLPEN